LTKLVACLAASILILAGCRVGSDTPDGDDPLVASVVASPVTAHRFTETVEGWGVIAALPESLHVVSPLYAGRVARLATHVGASVTAGDALCEILLDPTAVAEIERLRRSAELADKMLARQKRAVEAGVSPRVALEQAQMEAANTRAEYDARIRDYDTQSHTLTLRAAVTGLVTSVDVHVGQQVDSSTKTLTVVDPAGIAADVRIDAAAAARVEVGQTAALAPPDAPGSRLAARVIRIAPLVDTASQRADVWIRTEEQLPPPGTFVRATIDVGVTEGLAVPRSALVKTDHGYRVFVLDGGIARARDVGVGTLDGDAAEVQSGVKVGEAVASGGAQELADGMHVVVHRSES
jgi:RND family efflux transporter MFP subunit